MKSYNQFAYIYDELMNDFDYKKWADYIYEIFDKYNIENKHILEMACGTGNLTKELLDRGERVVAFDLSEDMLSVANEKIGLNKLVKFLNLDMTDFNLNNKFTSVVSICDSISYITDLINLKKVFKNAYNHLEDDGIFIFDINSEYKIKSILGNNTFVYDKEDIFYSWENYYNEDTKICDFFLTFFVEVEENLFERFNEEHSERAHSVEEIVGLLKSVGFKTIEYFNAFSFDDIGEESERINFVALK